MRRSLLALTALAALLLAAAPAQATAPYPGLTHLFDFGTAGGGAGQLSGPIGIAVNDTAGDVYVADTANNRIAQFTATGTFIRAWGGDVVASGPDDTGTGPEVCDVAANPTDVCKAGAKGFAAGSFKAPTGIAIDNSAGPAAGSVYVQDSENQRVQRFDAAGNFVLMWGKGVNSTSGGDLCPRPGNPGDVCGAGTATSEPVGFNDSGFSSTWAGAKISVDGAGHVYTAAGGVPTVNVPPGSFDPGDGRLVEFDSSGAILGMIRQTAEAPGRAFLGGLANIAVDETGKVYLALETSNGSLAQQFNHSEFTPSGVIAALDRSFPSIGGESFFAVDPSNRYVFVVSGSRASPCGIEPGEHVVEYTPGGQVVDCSGPDTPGMSLGGPGNPFIHSLAVSAAHRLYISASNQIRVFATPVAQPPAIGEERARNVVSSSALIEAPVTANLAETTVRVEYGTAGPCSANACQASPGADAGVSLAPETQGIQLNDLTPDTTYHYRMVADNGVGSPVAGADRKFHTFPAQVFDPSCPNNLARQQTGAALLADCRAYELVSAEDQGGYNVESDLVAGETPFGGYPEAEDRALYTVHEGVVPDSGGKPTNRGPDPYVAERDEAHQRWSTRYVGIPADAPSDEPFSSTLQGADTGLASFAFAGPELCDPCFGDGSVGIPIHAPDGSLIQGMAGSLPVALPVSAPGAVKNAFSPDGSRFLFGSKQQFEPAGNSSGTDVTIYSRDLRANTTEVVSVDDSGATIENGEGVLELAVSADGTRTVIGEKLGSDAAGNPLWRLYLHIAGNPASVELTPGAASGALWAGMTANASTLYFTTEDALSTAADQDTDTSADLYRAEVDPGGALTLTRVSVGEPGTGDTDVCDPAANSSSQHWNAPFGAAADCSAAAIGGGGGVAAASGAIYFLSPERLDTSGATQPVQDAPNLYLARPGQTPRFVATLESELSGRPSLAHRYVFTRSISGFSRATGVAVDPATGDVYVLNLSLSSTVVRKFDAAGNPVNFTAGSAAGSNQLTGSDAPTGAFSGVFLSSLPAEIAVDPSSRKLYVPDYNHNVVDVFNSDGSYDSQLAVTAPSGVAIDPGSGDVYVTSKTTNKVVVFPAGGGGSTSFTVINGPIGVAVDSLGSAYVVNGTQTAVYSSSGSFMKVLVSSGSVGVAVDSSDDVFVDRKSEIVQFDSAGNPTGGGNGVGGPIGDPTFSGSLGFALAPGGNLYASFANSKLATFLRLPVADPSVDSTPVLHASSEPATRHTADFQTTPSGDHAALPSSLPLDGSDFDSAEHTEIFRYDAPSGTIACASCNPTLLPPTSDAALPADGLGVSDDGRVFFDTGEPLVLRDVNKVRDAYQWDGRPQLISSGNDSSDSGLLSISRDGTDAFFFTRETLAENDRNGHLMKLYDARANGGFFVIPPVPSCVASDECHGPGSRPADPPAINSLTGSGGNAVATPKPKRCRRGKVRRHGRCVAKKRQGRHRRAAAGRGGTR